MFGASPFVSKVQGFYNAHKPVRHSIVHGSHDPQMPETKSCVIDAIEIYKLVDETLNLMHTTPIEPPDFS